MSHARRIWRPVHRYLGLGTFLVLLLLGLSGSIITYQHEVDAWLNPGLLKATESGEAMPASELAERARQAIPVGADLEWARMPAYNGEALSWFYRAKDGRRWELTMDSRTGKVLGQRPHDDHLIRLIYRFHADLYAGTTGNVILGVIALLFIVQIVSGLSVWWPRSGKWRQALTIKTGVGSARLNFDMHRVTGAYASALLLVSAFTGIYMALPPVMNWAVSLVSPVTETPALKFPSTSGELTIDEAITRAAQVFPGSETRILVLPTADRPAFEISMYRPDDRLWRKSGEWVVFVDARSGEILHSRQPDSGSMGDRFIAWLFPLHNGEAFGEPSRAIVCILGFAPALLAITGLLVWLRKKKSKRREA